MADALKQAARQALTGAAVQAVAIWETSSLYSPGAMSEAMQVLRSALSHPEPEAVQVPHVRRYTIDEIADACVQAEISDGHFESLSIALLDSHRPQSAAPQPPAQANSSPEMAGMQAAIGHLSALVEEQRVLLMEVEDVCGRDGHGGPLEDGESELIDKVRRHLRMLQPAQAEARGDEPDFQGRVIVGYSVHQGGYCVYEETGPGEFAAIKGPFKDKETVEREMLAPAAPQAGEAKTKSAPDWFGPSLFVARLIDRVVGDVAELPDRNSPEDWPEAMLVTRDELADIIRAALPIGGAFQPASQPMSREGMSQAAQDVLAERRRQIEAEGWTPEHDDEHGLGELARAAACYALHAASQASEHTGISLSLESSALGVWPWDQPWHKPGDQRRNLVKAGALILAELERLDRASAHGIGSGSSEGDAS